jgi:hypothetical protein
MSPRNYSIPDHTIPPNTDAAPSSPAITRPRNPTPAIPLEQRAAYSPTEFAALFGRKKTWSYRQLYAGRVRAITTLGQLMIPRSEAERLLASATIFNGDPKRAPKARKKATPTTLD